MRGNFLPAVVAVLFLSAQARAAQAPPLAELPPPTPPSPPVQAVGFTNANTNTAAAPPAAAPPQASREIRFVQGDPNPNLNPKPHETVRQDLLPPADPLEARPLLKEAAVTFTWLTNGGGWRSFGSEDLEGNLTFQFPLAPDLEPLLVKPGGAVHFWQQPTYGQPQYTLGLPDRVYDLWVDVGWRPRVADWLFVDLGLTPGFYADFNNDADNGFRLRGRALGIFCFSEQLQLVAGAIAANRNRVNWLPAGGVLYSPSPDVQLNLFFPAPKAAWRCRNDGCREWWLYVAGEWGGGTWAVRRADVFDDSVDYSDVRLNVGFEWKAKQGVSGLFEIGYVFSRQFYFANSGSTFDVDPTVMLRFGLVF